MQHVGRLIRGASLSGEVELVRTLAFRAWYRSSLG
jgi:hypothetical protein